MIIRSGDLDRTIVIMRAGVPTITASRAKTENWAPLMTLRAKLVEASAIDALRSGGTFSDDTRVFLTRWIDGITTADRIAYQGVTYTIKAVAEIGRRIGIQFRCEAENGAVK